MTDGWEFWIDRGGTFTDVVGRTPDGALHVDKLLSDAPGYADAAVEGVRRLLARHGGGRVSAVKMGTTVATNALLERRGEPTLLAITAGHADALTIGWQARPRLFDLDISKPPPLHAEALEIAERVTAEGEVLRPLDEDAARDGLQSAFDRGLRAVAVVLMHGHAHRTHEARVAAIAREVGFTQVSASHEVAPLIRLIPRGDTTVVDAYLSPVLHRYVGRLTAELRAVPGCEDARVLFMQSSGGLTEAARVRGKDAVLSGPAGGVVGLAAVAAQAGFGEVIGFDMGGTSTDVSRWAGAFERATETEVAGVRLRAPVMALHTVAAGGGSVCRWEGGRLRVGPQSAGADPGPSAYRRGGPLTVTDANFLLGRLQPDLFPAVFGPCADQPPDVEAVRAGFEALAAEVSAATGREASPEVLAEGCLTVAVEHMAQAIRRISVARGYDPGAHTLVSFGGAGGQHACRVAEALGIGRVMLHPLAGVLSAYGMGLAERRAVRERTAGAELSDDGWPAVERLAAELSAEAQAALAEQGVEAAQVSMTLGCSYAGVDATLPVPLDGGPHGVRDAFERLHAQRFGFSDPERGVVVETVTAEAATRPERLTLAAPSAAAGEPSEILSARLWVDGGWREVAVHDRARLAAGMALEGPALVREDTGTLVLEPGWRLEVDRFANLVLTRLSGAPAERAREVLQEPFSAPADPVRLELYASRFMAIAEQMGAALQNTASSVNIKERLDFSCAVFDAAGALIANAPHMPVHLGSMGDSVRAVMRARAADRRGFRAGDAWMLNDPYDGGTHLPDVTVVAPVFSPDADGAAPPFAFVAARGHQADIGGITPGSMPPMSRTLDEEGVLIRDVHLVEGDGRGGGRLREAEVRTLLSSGPHPARDPEQNLADLKAQVAACARGASELRALAAAEGVAAVSAYMEHLQVAAAESVRRVIDRLEDGAFAYATDAGAEVRVAVRVDRAARRAVVDFSGTSAQLPTNFNAPRSVARAAVLYVFRCLVDDDIPLNDGCMRPLEIAIPDGSMLSPRPPAAVVAGNVETSQVVVDALLGALGVVAASQGTMNNLTFGDARRQYYETICGGAGAGPGFDGASAVQTHMTNSRLTDPEILETRYPVILDRFAIRRGSGGEGAHRGGDGVERRIVFREPMTVSILSNRRRVAPYGLAGGAPGALGATRVERADGLVEALGSTQTVELAAGDAVAVETPGGGGCGAA